jgi:DNA-binding transcriptional regulator YhcF (GntR family)
MPELPISSYPTWRVSGLASKATQIANYCFYQIAMGRWSPGSRLPAVRELEAAWSVNRLTILKAYGLLAARGLVHHKPNGSYYVAEQGSKRNFARDRIQLEGLYKDILAKIKDETDLSPLGVLRVLVRIAESELANNPDVAFVECSRSQATDHAREIAERLHIPVIPLTLDEIRGKKMRIPPHVRVVFTTSFHADELSSLRETGTEVVALPIEISRSLLTEIEGHKKEVIFLESDETLAQRTTKDAIWMMDIKDPNVKIVTALEDFLSAYIESNRDDLSDALFLIPQKEWETLDPKWHEQAFVRPIECTLSVAAWPLIFESLRIPFESPI